MKTSLFSRTKRNNKYNNTIKNVVQVYILTDENKLDFLVKKLITKNYTLTCNTYNKETVNA